MVMISALVKLLAEEYPVGQILFFRFAFAAIPLFLFALWAHGPRSMKTKRYRDHAIRTVSGITSLTLFFTALSLIPLAEATMLTYVSPLFITLLSIPILGERIHLPRWTALMVGFVGVIIVVQPGSAVFSIGGLLAIGAAITAAVVVIWLRVLSDTENATTTAIIYNSTATLVFSIWLLHAGWHPVSSTGDWLLLMGVGLLAAFQQFFFAVSFRYGEASLLAPFEYLILVFAGIVGYLFWSEIPPTSSIAGGIIIASSGLFIIFRERMRKSTRTGT